MRKFLLILALVLFTAIQAEAMHCGNKIVSRGDSKYTVIARCGQPAMINQLGWNTHTSGYHERSTGRCYRRFETRIVEEWLYIIEKHGHKQMYRVRFDDNGYVHRIEWLGEVKR